MTTPASSGNALDSAGRYIPLWEVADLLETAICSGKTGVFVLATEDNRSAYFALEQEGIRNLVFQRAKGVKALRDVIKLGNVRCKFSPNKNIEIVESNPDLKDWRGIIDAMKRHAPAEVKMQPKLKGTIYSAQEILPAMIEEAMEYLGPMAEYICNEYFDGVEKLDLTGLEKVLDQIAADIDDPANAQLFKSSSMSRIVKGGG